MKITDIAVQARNANRVNISVDGSYRFSLDIYQVSDLGIAIGREYSEQELVELEEESVFGKLYARALEYTMLRPHSSKEVRDYLWRKTRDTHYRSRSTGEVKLRTGVSQALADRVYERLLEKGYINDHAFTKWWVENRHIQKGTSRKKLASELASKGVSQEVIHEALGQSTRDEQSELKKIIAKKRSRYPDEQKFIAYLARQGFSYDAIREALSQELR